MHVLSETSGEAVHSVTVTFIQIVFRLRTFRCAVAIVAKKEWLIIYKAVFSSKEREVI